MRHLPSTKALRYFSAVAATGGIRGAASELGITQSAVSHQIDVLQNMLGLRLLKKRGRNLVLTTAGKNYLQHVNDVLRQLEQATAQATQYRDESPINVSAPPTFISNWILPNFGTFAEAHPRIPLRLVQSLTHDKMDALIDISIEYRFGQHPGLDSQPLFSDTISIFASPDYVEKHKLSSLDDLKTRV